jgi:hypothetical protein
VSPQDASLRSFEAARQAADLRQARTLGAADSVAALNPATHRRVGDRIFVLRDSVWTDSRLTAETPRVRVKPYSAAYFAVLDLQPEIRSAAAIGERLIVAGKGVAVEFTPAGADRLTDADVTALRTKW